MFSSFSTAQSMISGGMTNENRFKFNANYEHKKMPTEPSENLTAKRRDSVDLAEIAKRQTGKDFSFLRRGQNVEQANNSKTDLANLTSTLEGIKQKHF